MRIAISAAGPTLDAEVDPRFGRCQYFIIVNLETMEFEALENSSAVAAGGAGISTGRMIASKGAEVVLTGNCGPNAYQVLSAAGLQVITGVSGKVRDAIEEYKLGTFSAVQQPNVDAHFGMSATPGMGAGTGSGMGGGGTGRGMGRGIGRGIELERAKTLATEVVKRLRPYCSRIEVAGSIRRQKPFVNDIDIVLVASDRWTLDGKLLKMGKYKMRDLRITRVEMGSIPLDIYFATPETFGTLLLIRTGSVKNNMRLCSIAKEKGWHLAANGNGLFDENRQRIAGDSEKSIYEALSLSYQEPWERN